METGTNGGQRHDQGQPTAQEQREGAQQAFVARVAEELAGVDPRLIAVRAGVEYDTETRMFGVRVFDTRMAVAYPTLEARGTSDDRQASMLWFRVLLAHYFRTADGTPLAGRWVTLRDLPGALLYERTFQGYTGNELVKAFGPTFDRLSAVATRLGAQPLEVGDVSFVIAALPRVPVAVVCYRGDEEQAPTARLLFDAAAAHYLPTDALATVGARLTGLLLKAGGVANPHVSAAAMEGWNGFARP